MLIIKLIRKAAPVQLSDSGGHSDPRKKLGLASTIPEGQDPGKRDNIIAIAS